MAAMLEFWFDFASTYSYPAALRLRALADRSGIAVGFRPFLLGPIFRSQGWDNSPFNLYPAKGAYMWRDLERLCADLALPFRRPDPFPQNSLPAARLALLGLQQDWGEEFCRAVFRAEFGEGRRIDDSATLSAILTALGVDAAAALTQSQSDTIKGALREQTAQAQSLGIFGAPAFVTGDGELFWGNDRLEQALAWAGKARTP
jgi:2-hydroxychromene-2-carboxylate isomerase